MPRIVDHQARRQEISAVAARLIAARGLEAATFREIARSSGYSKGVVEHYFDDKEALISGALDWANRCYETRVEAATAGLSGLPALHKRIEATLPLDKTTRTEWQVRLVFWSLAAIRPELRKQQAARLRRAVAFFQRDIVAAIEAGDIPAHGDAADQARRLLNATTGLCTAALHDRSRYTRALLQRELAHLLQLVSTGSL